MVSLLAFLDDQPDDNFMVIFDDLKRFARDTRFHLDLGDAFRKRGATIQYLNFKFDETPEVSSLKRSWRHKAHCSTSKTDHLSGDD